MITIQLTRGLTAVADDDCFNLLSKNKWQAQERSDGKGWYAVGRGGQKMHRVIMGAPLDMIVDHINGDGLDNRKTNLRVGTQSQNCVNRKNTPGKFLRGVRLKKSKWQAYIKYRGKQRSLGYFDTEIGAHEAYLIEAKAIHKDWMPLPSAPTKE